jgi:DNA-directed RNA polymerase specialized sigma24 family protein
MRYKHTPPCPKLLSKCYSDWRERLLSMASRIIICPHEADGLVTDIFADFHTGKRKFVSDFGWAYRIVKNACIDFYRKQQKNLEVLCWEYADTQIPITADAPERVSAVLICAQLKKLLYVNPDSTEAWYEQEVAWLKYSLGLTRKQIAQDLALPEKTIRKYEFRVARRAGLKW